MYVSKIFQISFHLRVNVLLFWVANIWNLLCKAGNECRLYFLNLKLVLLYCLRKDTKLYYFV